MADYTFRLVKDSDIPAILQIYRTYVEQTATTFEVETPGAGEFADRVKGIAAQYPYIVCVSGGRVIGYAYAHRHMERAAYQWNAELSVYIDGAHQRCGLGKKLYAMLMEILKLQHVKNVYGGVTAPNEKSERLHESFGFVKLGTYRNTGYKCGAWHDVMWFEKAIGPYGTDPAPFLPIAQADAAVIADILKRYGFTV